MNALASVLLAQTSGLLSDTVVAAFAILGGAAGFVSLLITLLRGRGSHATAAVAQTLPTPVLAMPDASKRGEDTPPPSKAIPAVAIAPPATIDDSIPADVMALISAAVAMTLGRNARIAAVMPVNAPPVELLQQWSIEGRRQIYSSHQIR